MPYYPKFFIQTNLHTNGGEFVIKETGEIYSGPYWKSGVGNYFSGETPQSYPQIQLSPISSISIENNTPYSPVVTKTSTNVLNTQMNNFELIYSSTVNETEVNTYLKLAEKQNTIPISRLVPVNNPNLPTQNDYQIGEFRRYFVKKSNEVSYIEVDKLMYNQILKRDPGVVWELYIAFNLPWAISGNKTQVEKTNRNITLSIMATLKLPKFGDYLKNDYLKYYK